MQVKEILEAIWKPNRDMLGKLPGRNYIIENEIVDKKIEERDEKIKSLEESVENLELSPAVVNILQYRTGNEEQYSRRQCLRINNINLPVENVGEDCMQRVKDLLNELDCGVGIDSFTRLIQLILAR